MKKVFLALTLMAVVVSCKDVTPPTKLTTIDSTSVQVDSVQVDTTAVDTTVKK